MSSVKNVANATYLPPPKLYGRNEANTIERKNNNNNKRLQ